MAKGVISQLGTPTDTSLLPRKHLVVRFAAGEEAPQRVEGRPIGANAFLAATAEMHRLTLVTRNVSNFSLLKATFKSLELDLMGDRGIRLRNIDFIVIHVRRPSTNPSRARSKLAHVDKV